MNILTLIKAKRAFSRYLDEKMSPALAYKIMKLVRAAEDEEIFYQKELHKLIQQYGERNSDGSVVHTDAGNVVLVKESMQECKEKVDELEMLEVATPAISFTLDELSCISLTVREMNAISPFIVEDRYS